LTYVSLQLGTMAWHVIAGLSSHQVKDENNEEIEVQDAVMAPPVAVVMVGGLNWMFPKIVVPPNHPF